jgi:hypothetical protein
MRRARICVLLTSWAAACGASDRAGAPGDAGGDDLGVSGGSDAGSRGDDLARGTLNDLALADLASRAGDLARPPGDLDSCQPPSPGTRTAPPFGPPTVSTTGLLVRVMNNCPFTLWVHGQGGDGSGGQNTLAPDNLALAQGQEQDYDAKAAFASARVTVFRDAAEQTVSQFVELNYGNGSLGYNVSYVDFLGLPVEAAADCGTTACYAPLATILDGCPANLKLSDRCVAAGAFCSDSANQGSAFCTALDVTAQQALSLSQCQSDLQAWLAKGNSMANVGSTPNVYACTNFWASSPFCCAVVNRGMVGASAPDDACGFYRNPPFNTYAQWVHQKCPLIYAFPYDDAAGQSGYHQCNASELRITFCPGG